MKELEIKNQRTQKTLKLKIYDGFENMDKMNQYLNKYTSLKKDSIAIIILFGQYYGVAIDKVDRAMIIGREKVWYYKNKILHDTTWRYFSEPYKMYPLIKKKASKNQVAVDLRNIDPNLKIIGWMDGQFKILTNHIFADTYLIALGRTFYDTYFNYDEYKKELIQYFDTYMLEHHFKGGVAGINPFQNTVMLTNGRVMKSRFY